MPELKIQLTQEEFKEYEHCLKMIDTAETEVELDAWYINAKSIIDKALNRQLKKA